MSAWRLRLLLPIVLHAFGACALFAQQGTVSGFVRDDMGNPLAGVQITLTLSQAAQSTWRATSGSSGEYRIGGLAPGEYLLSAEVPDYNSPTPLRVHVVSPGYPLAADLRLTSKTKYESDTKTDHSPLQFEAAGIRGLIDPGGYSASTNNVSSGLLRGIADIRRTDPDFSISTAKNWPCSLESELSAAVAEHPGQVEPNRRLGQFYVAHNRPAKAIPLLKRALEINANDIVASRQLAIAWMQTGDFQSARKLLASLMGHHSDIELHQLAARADEGSGMFLQAALEYREAEKLESSEENVFGEGYELILAGSLADGTVAFENGVRKYPRSISLRIGAGTNLLLLGKNAEGIHMLLEAADIDPNDPRPYLFLANGLTGIDQLNSRVCSSFKRFFDKTPESADANYYYALSLSRGCSATDAGRVEGLLKQSLKLNPNLALAHLQLGDLYVRRDDYVDAVPELEAAVRLQQNPAQTHYRLAIAYRHVGRPRDAAREMEIFRLSKENPSTEKAGHGIDVSQFISVMDAPNQHNAKETECPAVLQ